MRGDDDPIVFKREFDFGVFTQLQLIQKDLRLDHGSRIAESRQLLNDGHSGTLIEPLLGEGARFLRIALAGSFSSRAPLSHPSERLAARL
ncbi:MAG TPA: hypothetical protein VKE51_07860 [Vicinamibacterales bacterium]|nr:hypothetical protein [Vicinamibacterales bacterium]